MRAFSKFKSKKKIKISHFKLAKNVSTRSCFFFKNKTLACVCFIFVFLTSLAPFVLLFLDPKPYLNEANRSQTPFLVNRPASVLCIILTKPENLISNKSRLIFDSWATRCDQHKFVSKIPEIFLAEKNLEYDPAKGLEINFDSMRLLQPPNFVEENYDNLSQKMFHTFAYVYDKNPDFDFYLKTDDDTFIFVDNLRAFLSDKNSSKPVTYGYDFSPIVEYGI